MERIRHQLRRGRAWAREFFLGDYRGAPVDYIMALAIVFMAMIVVVASGLS